MNHIKKALITMLMLMTPLMLQAKEFLNTFMHINLGVMYNLAFMGDLRDEEDTYSIVDNGKTYKPTYFDSALGITVDLVPFKPIVLGYEAHAIKIGVRGGFRMHYLQQTITVVSGNDETEYGGDLMTYKSWCVGPVIYYAPSISPMGIGGNYSAKGGFTFFMLYGRLFDGKLTAFPAQRSNNEVVGDYEAKITGSKFDIGCGAEIRVCSINLGLNIFYSLINLNMDKVIYPALGRNTILHGVNIEVYMGIPLENKLY